jgi:phosphoglycolate phosphatase-like HAD superfamily hydrolase
MVYEYLEPTGLHHHLSVISTFENSNDWRRDKTPQLIELCKRLKLSPREACMVGDHPTDILSAQRAGFSLKIAVLSGESDESVLKQTDPDHITHSIREVPSIIDIFHDT